MSHELELVVKVPEEYVGELLVRGLARVLSNCIVEVAEKSKINNEFVRSASDWESARSETEKMKNSESLVASYSGERTKKKLIKFRCSECGEFNYLFCEKEEDGKYHITCRQCGKVFEFGEKELTRVDYNCPNCKERTYFFMPEVDGTGLDFDLCRYCKANVQLEFDAGMKMYISK